jgi:hypothetical protein
VNKETTVLIGTGSIGTAIIRRLGIGRTILLADYNETALTAFVEQLRTEGFEVVMQVTNTSDRNSVRSLADTAASLGPVTRVVHAADARSVNNSRGSNKLCDLHGSALILEEFGRVIAPGAAGVVISNTARQMVGKEYPREVEDPGSSTPLAPELLGDSHRTYVRAEQANPGDLQATVTIWEERGARIHSLITERPEPGAEGCGHIMATLVARLKDRTTTHVTDTVALDRAAGSPSPGALSTSWMEGSMAADRKSALTAKKSATGFFRRKRSPSRALALSSVSSTSRRHRPWTRPLLASGRPYSPVAVLA